MENFEYIFKNEKNYNFEDLTLKTQYKIQKMDSIKDLQNQFLNNLNVTSNENMAEDIPMEIIENIENKKEKKFYEVQYIIKHKKTLDKYEFLVKWKKYTKDHNSWVKENDFIEKDIINKYWKSIKRS